MHEASFGMSKRIINIKYSHVVFAEAGSGMFLIGCPEADPDSIFLSIFMYFSRF
jgi:hypothetical protein